MITFNYRLNKVDSVFLKQNVNTNNQSDNFNIRFNFSEPIMQGRFLDLIYAYSQSYVNNDRATYVVDPVGNSVFSDLTQQCI